MLCDRFSDSTRVYQGASGADGALLNALDRVAIGDTRPDLTFIIDVPVELGLERIRARRIAVDAPPDRFEGEALAQQEKRRQAFLAIAASDPARCVVIDGARSEDRVAEAIWQALAERLLGEAVA